MNTRALLGLGAIATLWAERVAACPSCVDPGAQTNAAMLAGTIALSITPVLFIGGVAFWVVRSSRKSGDDDVERGG